MQDVIDDPISAPIKEILAIFQKELSSVTFPDVSQTILENLIEDVRKNAVELEAANAQVIAARETLEASQNDLLQKCLRGLAYAKVYAEDKEELLENILRINLGKPQRIPKKTDKNRTDKFEDSTLEEKNEKKTVRNSKKNDDLQAEDISTEQINL
jgi:hypothetical protein